MRLLSTIKLKFFTTNNNTMYGNGLDYPYYENIELPDEVKSRLKKELIDQRIKNFQKKLPKYIRKMREANKELAEMEKEWKERGRGKVPLIFYISYVSTKHKADKYADLVNLGNYQIKLGSKTPFEKYKFMINNDF